MQELTIIALQEVESRVEAETKCLITKQSKIAPTGLDLHCYAAPALYRGVSGARPQVLAVKFLSNGSAHSTFHRMN